MEREKPPALTEALRDTGLGVRGSAAEALGKIGPAAVPLLTEALRDADSGVRVHAAAALGEIGPAAIALLHERGISANELHKIFECGNNQPRRWARIGAPRYVALALAAVLEDIPPWTPRRSRPK